MINLHDYERAALRTLPPAVADYYAGGAADECSLRADGAAYAALRLLPRVLRDVSERDLATALLGVPLAAPVIIAPTAFQALAHPAGEVATARAAARCGTLMTLSTLSTQPMEAVGAAGAPWWFQLYVYRDRAVTRALVERARAAGAQALVLTVDNQVFGPRERDQRNRFALPPGLQPVNLQADRDIGVLPAGASGSALAAYAARTFDPALAWTDLEWLVADAGLPVVVKGILRADDAQRAAACGAAAVWVSNHGGRQLDTALPPIEALPAIAARHMPAASAGRCRSAVPASAKPTILMRWPSICAAAMVPTTRGRSQSGRTSMRPTIRPVAPMNMPAVPLSSPAPA